jgi:DNA repair protein RadA/Sms
VGGLRVTEPAADLAIILSIASAFKDAPVPANLVAFGEVGLSGELRSVSQTARRVSEAKRLGYDAIIGPSYRAAPGMIGAASVADAVSHIAPRPTS